MSLAESLKLQSLVGYKITNVSRRRQGEAVCFPNYEDGVRPVQEGKWTRRAVGSLNDADGTRR